MPPGPASPTIPPSAPNVMGYSHDSQSSFRPTDGAVNEGEEEFLADYESELKEPENVEALNTRGRAMSSFSGQINVPIDDGATVTSVTLNLIGGGLGTGILSMPWGMAGGSVFVSLGVLAVVLAVNAFTIMILIHAGEKYKQFELGCLLGMLPGKLFGTDRESGQSRGFGHVDFTDTDACTKAVEEKNGTQLDNRDIRVDYAGGGGKGGKSGGKGGKGKSDGKGKGKGKGKSKGKGKGKGKGKAPSRQSDSIQEFEGSKQTFGGDDSD